MSKFERWFRKTYNKIFKWRVKRKLEKLVNGKNVKRVNIEDVFLQNKAESRET